MPDPTFEGLGFFYASSDMLDPEKAARRCADAGASWACVLVESVDGRRQTAARIAAAVAALRALDIRADLYTFPHPSKGDEGARRAVDAAKASGISRVVIDAEPFVTDTERADWTTNSLASAGRIVTDAGLDLAWTTFPRRRWAGVTFPPGPMLLQIYKTIRDIDDAREAIEKFGQREIVVCVGTHLDDGLLPADLAGVDALIAGSGVAKACGVWACATTSKREGEALRAWATRTR